MGQHNEQVLRDVWWLTKKEVTEGGTAEPKVHGAGAHAEGEQNKVIREVQRGYTLHDRVLRPGMVVVGKGGEDEGEDDEVKESEGEPANG